MEFLGLMVWSNGQNYSVFGFLFFRSSGFGLMALPLKNYITLAICTVFWFRATPNFGDLPMDNAELLYLGIPFFTSNDITN